MTPERFRELTEIYGAEPRRWPADERDAALAYLRDHAVDAEAAFADAMALDDMLSRHAVAPAGAALREQIVASAPMAREWTWRPARLVWQSAGLVGLGLAGALAGAIVISTFMPFDRQGDEDESAYVLTAFDEAS